MMTIKGQRHYVKEFFNKNQTIKRRLHGFKDAYGLWIDGKEVISPNAVTFNVNSPATGQYLTKVVSANSNDVNHAADIAHKVYQSGVWSKADVRERSRVMNRIADKLRSEIPRLAELEVAQTGRAVREMKAQLARLPEWFEYFGSLIRTHEGACISSLSTIKCHHICLTCDILDCKGTVPPFFGPYVNYVKRVPLGVVAQLTPWNHPMLIAVKVF